MSGAALAVGPRVVADTDTPGELKDAGTVGGVMGSLRVIELQLVAFIVVFSASGLVPMVDLIFPIFASLYAFTLSVFVFPKRKNASPQEVFQGNRAFQVYVILGTSIGLFLPLSYVLGGFARGDQMAVRAATPHLFLLSFQILTENLIRSFDVFSLPVRALIPIFYNARRLVCISHWLHATFINATLPPNPKFQHKSWMWFGRGLSAANFIYFSANLFVFLLPMFLPRAFERYFKDREAEEKKKSSGGMSDGEVAADVDDQPPSTQQKSHPQNKIS